MLNAHYTTPAVVSAMYQAVERLGFTGGRVLEPAVGLGHFFGLIPEDHGRGFFRSLCKQADDGTQVVGHRL